MQRVALALVVVLAACPGDDGTYDPTTYVKVDDYASAYKDAECAYLTRCGFFPDQMTCLAAHLFTDLTLDPDVVGAIHAGHVFYNGNAVRACFDALAAATCDKTDEDGRVTLEVCRDFTRGTVGGGQPCTIDAECISNDCRVLVADQACAMGTCFGDTPPATELPANGEACSTLLGCTRGSFCDPGTLTCTTLRSAGDQCISNSDCDYGLGCAGSPRTCQLLPALGAACPDGVCRDDGVTCSAGQCTRVGLVGASCSSSSDCSPYYACNVGTSLCEKLPSVGETCSASNSRCFDEASYCDPATLHCVAAKLDGDLCTTSLQCRSENCDPATNTCTTPTCFP